MQTRVAIRTRAQMSWLQTYHTWPGTLASKERIVEACFERLVTTLIATDGMHSSFELGEQAACGTQTLRYGEMTAMRVAVFPQRTAGCKVQLLRSFAPSLLRCESSTGLRQSLQVLIWRPSDGSWLD